MTILLSVTIATLWELMAGSQGGTTTRIVTSNCALSFVQRMMRNVVVVLLLSLSATANAFAPNFGARLVSATRGTISRPAMRPRVAPALRMQDTSGTALSEFKQDGKAMTQLAKEKLYLDCCASFNTAGESSPLSDEEFESLKTDLTFEGSRVMLMTREEIKFMSAMSRYNDGKPILSDEEFDTLRKKLKKQGSFAVLHEAATCRLDPETGKAVCKSDLFSDDGKNAILYAPAAVLSALLFNEYAFWFNGWDPLFSLILGSPFIIAITYVLTNFIYFQSPYVTKAICPECSTPQNIFFGDILWVQGGVTNEVTTQCTNKACACTLTGFKDRMIVESIKD